MNSVDQGSTPATSTEHLRTVSFKVGRNFCIVVGHLGLDATVLLHHLVRVDWEDGRTNHHPTLINQLVATNCFCTIIYNLVGQMAEIILALYGPFNTIVLLCSGHPEKYLQSPTDQPPASHDGDQVLVRICPEESTRS